MLAFALAAIRATGRKTGWHRSADPGLGSRVRATVAEAERWLRTGMLSGLGAEVPGPHVIARVRASRARKRHQSAVDVVALHGRYVRRLDRPALLRAVEDNALLTTKDDVLLRTQARAIAYAAKWGGAAALNGPPRGAGGASSDAPRRLLRDKGLAAPETWRLLGRGERDSVPPRHRLSSHASRARSAETVGLDTRDDDHIAPEGPAATARTTCAGSPGAHYRIEA